MKALQRQTKTHSLKKNKMIKSLLKYKFFLLCVIVSIIIIIGVIAKCTSSYNSIEISENDKIDVTPTLISSISDIGEMEYLSINDEIMIDSIRKGYFSDDELIRIYYGVLRLGINFKELNPNFISVKNDSVIAVLPPIKLLDANFIDETRTLSFHEKGTWNSQARAEMYKKAYAKMLRKCFNDSTKAMAENIAIEQMTQLLHSMDFKKVKVSISK